MSVFESSHPLVKHKVSLLRDNNISVKAFRELTKEISMLLTVEATQHLSIKNIPLTCWSGDISVPTLADKQPTLVPILRAGLGMLEGSLSILPCAKISVVGIQRNEDTLAPESYYENIISDIESRTAIIIDPMLATGGTALATIDLLKASGCKTIIALFLVAAPEGIKLLEDAHPDVTLTIGVIDEKLNEQGYILPGLGDAGDKIFGTL
ncbi:MULTISPECIES: uracil phosphoribosyltransferase [unclassified Colwellia]|uniref:uracil phosphoribosyltransferase n=1 Tax=unclassified Colwellia TaxID=196834 RepID=UPI0015F5EA98|nr:MULTISPECIES: uracil phosphoribosyltransferase [unclassified Colwellia]MBA6355704.1 uracil phosphoribosyltransferase [Colwellia sp. BRX8-3]MBA6361881.1 uracil phosphoribosyltransferase [Colwellia sp. BRX8-6]MBA6367145.1 uracil phosphoribosyltransferase [Colwellia sp. BRX8-5]MBA6374395.1 uracil phosphoribosyltransferase [Colwellia sp. BRX8-2]